MGIARHPKRKTPDELMEEAFWTRRDICRLFRKDPRIIDRYIHHSDPKKRLKSYMINNTWMAEKREVLKYFRHYPFGKNEKDPQIGLTE
jgi:hypothetical protein